MPSGQARGRHPPARGEIHGISGMLIAIPLIPLVKETIVFLRPRLAFEGWGAATGGAIVSMMEDAPAGAQDGAPAATD